MSLLPTYHEVDDFARLRSTIDIVPKENLNRTGDWTCLEVDINAPKKVGEKVSASVDVANGVDAPVGRHRWSRPLPRRPKGLP
jgi:hypothetical protein